MMQRLSCLFYGFLKIAANAQRLGLGMIRVAILIIFVWIGGLKFRNYEAEGIVPFVANSPFMSFFYNEKAPEYRDYKLKEGEYDAAKHAWHEKNNTYGFSHGLGLLIMGIGILTFLGFFSARIGGRGAAGRDYDARHAVVSGDYARSLGAGAGQRGIRVPVALGRGTAGDKGYCDPCRCRGAALRYGA